MRILYCTDFTQAALYSLERARPFLRDYCKVDVISTIEIEYLTAFSSYPTTYKNYLELSRKNKAEKFEERRSAIEGGKLHIENFLYPEGNAADEILNQLKNESYSLIIMGSRTKMLFGKWLGSTSRKIAEKSPVPLFVAKKKIKEEPLPESKNVLFTVDGTENSYNSIKKAIEILDLKNSGIEVLHIKKGKESLPPEIVSDQEWLKIILKKEEELSREIIERVCHICREKNIKVDTKTILEGSAVDKILDYTDENKKDLIVMGSHGREGISSLLLGSVSKRVLDNTYCPVMIIPTKKGY